MGFILVIHVIVCVARDFHINAGRPRWRLDRDFSIRGIHVRHADQRVHGPFYDDFGGDFYQHFFDLRFSII